MPISSRFKQRQINQSLTNGFVLNYKPDEKREKNVFSLDWLSSFIQFLTDQATNMAAMMGGGLGPLFLNFLDPPLLKFSFF